MGSVFGLFTPTSRRIFSLRPALTFLRAFLIPVYRLPLLLSLPFPPLPSSPFLLVPNDDNLPVLMQHARGIDAEPYRRNSPPLENNSDKGEVERNECVGWERYPCHQGGWFLAPGSSSTRRGERGKNVDALDTLGEYFTR